MLYIISVIPALKAQNVVGVCGSVHPRSTVVSSVCTGYMWALVPEVISYGEYTHGKQHIGHRKRTGHLLQGWKGLLAPFRTDLALWL